MEKGCYEEDFYLHLNKLIKSGNLKDALFEVQGKHLDSKNALRNIVAISLLAYNNVSKEVEFKPHPDVVLHLTESLCSSLELEASNALRYLTSLYHIQQFLIDKDYLMQATCLFKTIVKLKKSKESVYEVEGKTLHHPFISILSNTILKEVKHSESSINESNIITLFSLLLQFLRTDKVIQNGAKYLRTVQFVTQSAKKIDNKVAVRLITSGLKFFYEVEIENIVDVDSCLSLLFQIYANLFSYQLNVSSYSFALSTIHSHLDQVKWKFKNNIKQGECFLILCNTVAMFKKNCPETSMLSRIKVSNEILESFMHQTQDTYILTVCQTTLSLITSSHQTGDQKLPPMPEPCLESYLIMLWNVFKVLEGFKTGISNVLLCLGEICLFISGSSAKYSQKVLKEIVPLIVKVETKAIDLVKDLLNSEETDSRVESVSILMLTRFANLARYYHVASMTDKVITISKPICKLICELPSDKFNTSKLSFQQLSDTCFTMLVHAYGANRLDKVVECLTMWMVHSPIASKTAFKLWADIKHNVVCIGSTDHLDDTIWTVISERKSQMDTYWLPCKPSNEEIATFLFEELKTYFVNKSLRGTPVIAATNALLSLGANCLLLVKGLVVGMDIASAFANYHDECLKYYTKSQSLIVKFRKEKNKIDPVEFNCWMGNLIYVQIRCQLKILRANCETEVVRLSCGPREPLVAELPESRPDPNDTCDIATKFGNLCLAKQRKLFADVDAAIRHWGFASSMMKENPSDYSITLTLVREAGALMRLYCDEDKQTKAWDILYTMATVVGDVNMIVSAVAEILNTGQDINEDWMANAKQHLEKQDLREEIRQMFLLNSAMYCLKNNKVMEGLKYLDSVEDNITKCKIQYTKFLITMGMYQRHVNINEYRHTFKLSPTYHFSFFKALRYLIHLAEDKKWGSFWEVCQIHHQLLQVSQLFGETFWSMEQPREARCYLKSQLPLAQKLALPLRTVQLLVVLAWVDLCTGMADDCAVKLGGIEDLLELCGTPVRYGEMEGVPTSLDTALLTEPEYLSHAPACHCLPCTTVEYRRLVLETVTLRATFCMAFGNHSHATACFQLAKRIQNDLSETKDQSVLCSCARMWIRLTGVLLSLKQLEKAMSAFSKAEELLPLIMDPVIHQLVVEQECQLTFISCPWLQPAPIKPLIVVEDSETIAELQTTPLKTPARPQKNFVTTKKKKPLTESNTNVTPITPFTRPVARLKILSSGEENTPPPKTKQKRKALPKFVTETPHSIQNSTKRSQKPFVFYHDDEFSVNNTATTSKPTSKIKKTDKTLKDDSEKSTKKMLFPYDNSISDVKLKTEVIPEDDNIIRKSKRTNAVVVKTYGKSKIPMKKGCRAGEATHGTETDTKGGSDVYSLDKMKKAISNVEERAQTRNASSTKISSSLCVTKKPSLADLCSSLSALKTDGKDSSTKSVPEEDCDLVEGTPPDPSKKTFLVRTRKARSNKV